METVWIIVIAAVALVLLALLATRLLAGRGSSVSEGAGRAEGLGGSSVALEEREPDLGDTLTDVLDGSPVETADTTGDLVDDSTVEQLEEALAEDRLVEEPLVKPSFFDRLGKARTALSGYLGGLVGLGQVDDEAWEDLEEALIRADVGVGVTMKLIADVQGKAKEAGVDDGAAILDLLKGEMRTELAGKDRSLSIDDGETNVWLFVGVNGVGKTTTIGKIAHHQREIGNKVVLCAGDTFRAAAIDQLKIWGERTGAEVVARDSGADSAGLAFDALKRARDVSADLLLIDTAGRLQNKANLMAELEKIVRVLKKQDETAPHAVLLVLDATTGQNAVNQVEVFRDVCQVTGLVMTKLDGSARGGVLVAVAEKFGLPVHYVGVGEQAEDLRPFDADDFARALCGVAD